VPARADRGGCEIGGEEITTGTKQQQQMNAVCCCALYNFVPGT